MTNPYHDEDRYLYDLVQFWRQAPDELQELMAAYGYAMAMAQLFEAAVAGAVAVVEPAGVNWHDPNALWRTIRGDDRATLEKLRKALETVLKTQDADLEGLIGLRNTLAHRFLRHPKRLAELQTSRGKVVVIAELHEAADRFRNAASAYTIAAVAFGLLRGMSEALARRRAERGAAVLTRDDPGPSKAT